MNEQLADRRARAREAFDDEWSGTNDMFGTAGWAERLHAAREVAIETAMRVRITPEIMRAASRASREDAHGPVSVEAVRSALEAAGFEVEP